MTNESRGIEWKVGLFMLIGLGVIAFMAIKFGRLSQGLQKYYVVTAEFPNASGLLNLIRNAMDAIEDSPKRNLVISVAPADDKTVRISVADSGSGISPDIAQQLFQPFMTTKQEGMGVGLSISRTIIESHDGRIWVEPNPTGGTIFHFTLAVVNEGDVDDAA